MGGTPTPPAADKIVGGERGKGPSRGDGGDEAERLVAMFLLGSKKATLHRHEIQIRRY
jgi:hypothetical protein